MDKFIFYFAFFILILVKKSTCWLDEGHLLVSAIAYQGLDDEERAILNKIFSNFKEDNEFNHPVSAAVWPDHIKSFDYQDHVYNRRVDILNLMDNWHFFSIPYNPLGVDIDFYGKCYKKRDNALHILKSIFTTLKNVNRKENHGTYFSYNFHLRFFIHIFGDAHQPLHTISFYNKYFPKGDNGGNLISIRYNDKVDKLHLLCDNLFYSRSSKWPNISLNEIFSKADELKKSYPPYSFGNRLETEMDEIQYLDFIVNDSHALAIKYIYCNFHHDSLKEDVTYITNDFLVLNLKKLLNEQIVLAGYRLTRYLKVIIANIPRDLV
ncbi:p1/s1 nuclease, putative [Plasmodium relictum]|uniref:p1/s1 nuclease, putative n=1 Tax=Plasmodium relictum TaxID=85471 RepID=A0A1J1HHT4_PLARL|nr:p1/s1 nuclease, putative [Plasmodium relictum]CRH04018.1 p1/s1 nuclease, putative [Plasmodium relictum]